MKKTLMVLGSMFVLSAVCFAGWEHLGGRTYWTEGATAGSCFIRNNTTTDVSPAIVPLVYYNTIKTNTAASFGFWGINTDGSYYPLADVGTADYDNRKNPGVRVDVEWLVDSNGDLVLKD